MKAKLIVSLLSSMAAVSADAQSFAGVPSANTKAPGITAPNGLTPELVEAPVAQGSTPLENRKSVTFPNGGTAVFSDYGYYGDGPHVPLPGTTSEATKSEPDKNTYLVLEGQKGADPGYDYGTHFLFQGHEAGSPGYITRINLDADGAHRVTLLATKDVNGVNLPTIDGSTWDPWAQRLLFTAELGSNGGVWQSTLDGKVVNLQRFLGRGGFEAIQNDDQGNLYMVEDAGGSTFPGTTARRPNSFVFRFIPNDVTDLTKG